MPQPRKPTPVTERLKAERIQLLARELPKWELNDEQTAIRRIFTNLPNLKAGVLFAGLVAEIAERQSHTAALLVQRHSVAVTLTTPRAGGLTERDFELASKLEFAG